MTKINRHNYPAIFTACVEILTDNGGLHRDSGIEDVAYAVFPLPVEPYEGLGHMEAALLEIAGSEDFQTFLIGEQTAGLAIAKRDPWLLKLHAVFDSWFESGMPVEVM